MKYIDGQSPLVNEKGEETPLKAGNYTLAMDTADRKQANPGNIFLFI